MATNELDKYKTLQKTLSAELSKSKTAYTPNVKPTQRDLQTQLDLIDIKKKRENLFGQIQEDKWYSKNSEESVRERDEGLLMKGIHALGMPLYGIVGGVEAALGKGTEKGLSNIVANIKEHGTFGDLIKSYNVPWQVSAPLGFALDVAFDPVMWFSAGASATIPRIAEGLYKKGATGALKAAESGVLQKASTVGRLIPGVNTEKLVQKAAESGSEFNKMIGRDVGSILKKRAEKVTFGEATENWLKTKPWGESLISTFKMRNRDWFEAAKMEDMLEQAGRKGEGGEYIFNIGDKDSIRGVKELMRGADAMAKKDLSSSYIKAVRGELEKIIDEGAEVGTIRPSIADKFTGTDVHGALGGEAEVDEIMKKAIAVIKDFSEEKTGVKWFDDAKKSFKDIKIKDAKVGEKILNEYDRFIKLFKVAKIGGNAAAYTNAAVGNLTMAMMSGINITHNGYIKNIGKAWSLLGGNVDAKLAEDILTDKAWTEFLEKFPKLFQRTYGVSREGLEAPAAVGKAFKKELIPRESGEAVEAAKGEGIAKRIESFFKKMGGRFSQEESVPSQILGREKDRLPTTFISEEIFSGPFQTWTNKIREKGEAGSGAAKALYWYLTQPMSWYERIDQSYKLGTAAFLSTVGVSERELMTLGKFLKINPATDITYAAKEGLWKLSPERATEAVQDIFMNYGAMPAAVKVLRSMPLFGAPFASFLYAMTVKTGKTVLKNPGVFNKVQFGLQEISPNKSPLEKYALDEPYYQWYKRDGMLKIPFFKDHPMYLNVANMIPYYTMNIFQPSERSYEKKLPATMAAIMDKMPFFKTPEGQIMFDYFIQPVILRETNPRGVFDQQLWPTDAGALQKLGYAGRGLVEAVMPPTAGLAGLVTPEAALPFIPSYRWRQLGYAARGKSPIGVETKEGSASKTLRTLSSMAGLPSYPLQLEYTSSKLKKDLKKK